MTATALAGPLVLPADVLLVPVADLSQAARLLLNCQDGDVAITVGVLASPSVAFDRLRSPRAPAP